jgi:hypothetical protein
MSAITPKIAAFVGANADAVPKESMRSWGISLEKMVVIHYLTIAELRADTTGDARACFVANTRYLYDSADTTTADDGGATLVSADGKRWKRQATGGGDLLAANNLSEIASRVAAYDNIRSRGADIASAATLNLSAATGDLVDVTGAVSITAITIPDGGERTVRFTGAPTITHGANLILPTGASIVAAAGDFAIFRGYAAGLVRCVAYTRASGAALSGGGGGGSSSPSAPQGRLTLTLNTPVMVADVALGNTVRYTPYVGQFVPLWDGSAFVMTNTGGELSQLTTDASKSPAACVANTLYDVFVWDNAGTKRATRGPAWANSGVATSARGTGAGTTELEFLNGVFVNKIAIANGPAARAGTYVGTILTNSAGTIDFSFGTTAAGGGEAKITVWNAYNRVPVHCRVANSAANWTAPNSTWRAVAASNTMRATFVRGLDLEPVSAIYTNTITASASGAPKTGINLNSTTATPGAYQGYVNAAASSVNVFTQAIFGSAAPGLGLHYLQAMESWQTGTTFYGNGSNLLSADMMA